MGQLLEKNANDALASMIMMFGNQESCIALANPLGDYKTMLLCDIVLSMPFRKRSSGSIFCNAMKDIMKAIVFLQVPRMEDNTIRADSFQMLSESLHRTFALAQLCMEKQ